MDSTVSLVVSRTKASLINSKRRKTESETETKQKARLITSRGILAYLCILSPELGALSLKKRDCF